MSLPADRVAKKSLGDMLVEEKLITPEQLESSLALQQQQVRIQLSITLEGVLYQVLVPKSYSSGRVAAVEKSCWPYPPSEISYEKARRIR